MKKVFFLVFGFLVLISCKRDDDQIPYVSFDFTVNINEPSLFGLSAVGGYEYVVGGSRGIIIYRKSFSEFVALERHSPYQVDNECQIVVLEDGIIVEDPCSGSQWVITDGSLLQGPASRSLTTYNTVFNDPYLRVWN